MVLVEVRMTRKVVTVRPADTLAAAASKMKAGPFRRLPVVEADQLIGIVSEFDLRRYPDALDSTLVEIAMTRDPITVMPSETLEHAAAVMRQHKVGALPVIYGGKLVGIVTAKDLMIPEPRPLPEWDPRTRRKSDADLRASRGSQVAARGRERNVGGQPKNINIDIPPVDEDPSDSDIHFLDDRINEYNVERTGIKDGKILSYFVRDKDGAIIAGLYGWTWGGYCEVRYLWVRQDYRNRGYGRGLMVAAESEAIARGCRLMILDTHSFQAPRFYRGLGFEIIATHTDYPHGHQKHYLKKTLLGS